MAASVTQLSWMMICSALPLCLLPDLPGNGLLSCLAIVTLILLRCRWQASKVVAVTLLLFVWCCLAGRQALEQITSLTTTPVKAQVRIEQWLVGGERLRVRLVSVDQHPVFPPVSAILNAAPGLEDACVGQLWQMTLNLRPVHARLNEGEFDRQRQALANHSPLTGRILALQPVNADCSWRQRVIDATLPAYQHLLWQGVISALAFGERAGMSAEVTALWRETGTAHLMAISGMHIGLAALFGWLLARATQFFFPLTGLVTVTRCLSACWSHCSIPGWQVLIRPRYVQCWH